MSRNTKKILIVSDSHGRNINLRKAIANLGDSLDMMIHLGDYCGDPEDIQKMTTCPVEMVRGNCDSSMYGVTGTRLIQVENHKLLITHGHQYGCKQSTGLLREIAKENGADIALFGHTHIPLIDTLGSVTLLNPGSISQPRQEGHRPTYLVMNIEEDGRTDYVLVYL